MWQGESRRNLTHHGLCAGGQRAQPARRGPGRHSRDGRPRLLWLFWLVWLVWLPWLVRLVFLLCLLCLLCLVW